MLKNNTAAIKFNKSFGYEILDIDTIENYYNCELYRDSYYKLIDKYRKVISNLYKDYGVLEVENFSFSNVSDNEILRLYTPLPAYLKEKLNTVLKAEGRINI